MVDGVTELEASKDAGWVDLDKGSSMGGRRNMVMCG